MRLFDDIKSKRLLKVKAALFAVTALLSGALLLAETCSLRNLAMLLLCIWSSCRLYYFFFHVIDHYLTAGSAAAPGDVVAAERRRDGSFPRPVP